MKKSVKIVSFISLVTLSGSAFAKTGPVIPALDQLTPVAPVAAPQAPSVPAPTLYPADSRGVHLQDITDKCLKDGEVVSAYPGIYPLIHSEENSRILKVFRFTDSKGTDRRVEVYFTGGDWMQYGLTYIVTNAGQNNGQVSAYFIDDLSTPDRQDGSVAPKVNPLDSQQLAGFVSSDLLDADGNVKSAFTSVVAVSTTVK